MDKSIAEIKATEYANKRWTDKTTSEEMKWLRMRTQAYWGYFTGYSDATRKSQILVNTIEKVLAFGTDDAFVRDNLTAALESFKQDILNPSLQGG